MPPAPPRPPRIVKDVVEDHRQEDRGWGPRPVPRRPPKTKAPRADGQDAPPPGKNIPAAMLGQVFFRNFFTVFDAGEEEGLKAGSGGEPAHGKGRPGSSGLLGARVGWAPIL